MKARLALSLIPLLLRVKAHPAMATWGSFVSLGTNTVNSDPSCAPLTSGGAVCTTSSLTNTMLVKQFNGTAWAGWKNLAGAITSAPNFANEGNGHVICAARSSNGGVVATVFNGTGWSTEAAVNGTLASALSCASLGSGRVLCAARSASGGLASTVFNGNTSSAFDSQAAKLDLSAGMWERRRRARGVHDARYG